MFDNWFKIVELYIVIELYQFPKLTKYLRRGVSDKMIIQILDQEIQSDEISPLLLHFEQRDGSRLVSSWFEKISHSNNGLFPISCFCKKEGFSRAEDVANYLFSSVSEIDGREINLKLSRKTKISNFKQLPYWIGDRGVWVVLIDHIESLFLNEQTVSEVGLPTVQSSNVRTIYTTSNPDVAKQFERSGIRVLDILGVSGHPENQIVDDILKSAGLNLPEELVSLIASKVGTDDSAFIRQLAGKLRVYGISDDTLTFINSLDYSSKV